MTIKERDQLSQLQRDLHGYHLEVQSAITSIKDHEERLDNVELDLRGNPKDREGNPGVMSQISDLRKSRKILLGVAAGAWTIATIVIGAVISHLV